MNNILRKALAFFLIAALPRVEGQLARPAVNNLLVNQARLDVQDLVQRPGQRLATPGEAMHAPFVEPMTAAKIRRAVDDAVQYIRGCQQPDGSIGGGQTDGDTALGALAMLAAGGDPASDEPLRKTLDWLAKLEVDNTYVRGIRANVWEYALRKVPYDEGIRAALKQDYEWLLKARGAKEAWRYRMDATDWDNSCSQYGVLGIWAAARAGFEPSDDFWGAMSQHFRGCQNTDGGWGYMASGGSTPNMATAGLASMFLVFDKYHGKSFYSAGHPRAFSSGAAASCLSSIERGMQWLGRAGLANQDAYFLYGIERVGVASGRKYIGGKDWFQEGAMSVLRAQGAGGDMRMSGHGDQVVHTAFCALFLVYGGAPVAFNKLEFGKDQDWNLNPRDLANLSKYLWSAYEQPLNWHAVSLSAPVTEFEAPILFLSGSQGAEFSDEEVAKLRDYVMRGGTILAEPADGSPAFRESAAALLGRMFPPKDYPACKLAALPPEHGVYTVHKQTWRQRPSLLGASDGSRTFFFLSDSYLSADWQMDKTDSDAFKFGMNLLFYATDLSTLQGRFASVVPDTPAAAARSVTATVARARYTGSDAYPSDWTLGPAGWQRFAPYFQHVNGARLEEGKAVDLAERIPNTVSLLHLTGAHPFMLTDAQRTNLKAYVEGGGTVLVDAYAGSDAFAGSARQQIEAVFGKLRPLDPRSTLATGLLLGGSDLTRGLKLKLAARRSVRQQVGESQGQNLEVAMVGQRPAVVFSPLDVTAALAGIETYGCKGYKPESARRIAANLLAMVSAD